MKKSAWSLEEKWILFLLQANDSNKWAEISSVIPGRPDNSIKNYWNSIRNSKSEMATQLEKYLNKCIELDNPTNALDYKETVVKKMKNHLIYLAQK